VYGGSGTVADWDAARNLVKHGYRIYLAGGLNPENVADAIKHVRPYAVDVASGVESSPGKKDPAKLAALIKAAKEAI
jgi:phosphoribosylanthranilate isomerase